MSGKHKVNPRRKPMTAEERENRAKDMGVTLAMAIFFTAVLDKKYLSKPKTKKLWDDCVELSDSIHKGYVNVWDLAKTLKEEYGILM